LLGKTRDDAAGEAFDKVARVLGLPQPGGPSISQAALTGDAKAFSLPIANVAGYDFSFSGLKTAVLRAVQELSHKDYTYPSHKLAKLLNHSQIADISASFQATAVETLVKTSLLAVEEHRPACFLLAGGVAANHLLRQELSRQMPDTRLFFPDIKLCTDNAAMIASLGYFATVSGITSDEPCCLEVDPSLKM
jgi:N6-L-threonylcarbamoyladenine synthase